MGGVIPEPYDRLIAIMLMAEGTQTCRVEHPQAAGTSVEPKPARGQNPEKMAARKYCGCAFDPALLPNDSQRPGEHIFWRFAPGTPIPKDIPSRSDRADFSASQLLIIPVVPLHQVAILRLVDAKLL